MMSRTRIGSVYFLVAEDQPWLKIGWATDVAKRLSQLQTGNPSCLHLILSIPGTIVTEALAHVCLTVARRGEWRALGPQTVALVERLSLDPPNGHEELLRIRAEQLVGLMLGIERSVRHAHRRAGLSIPSENLGWGQPYIAAFDFLFNGSKRVDAFLPLQDSPGARREKRNRQAATGQAE